MAACACAVCDIAAITAYLRSRVPALRSAATSPEIAVVCGSGLSRLSDLIENPVHVPYADIPRFPQATVAGHGTELVFGTLGGRRVVAQRGRFHAYEGHSMARVATPVRVFAALGCRVMLATNAAGGVNADFRVGDIMVIKDHVSLPCLGGSHPLTGANDERLGPRFPPMTAAYDAGLQALAARIATKRGLGDCLRSGV
jgi:purine-nucleoside phosphorylase